MHNFVVIGSFFLNWSTTNFGRISNSIEIPLVGRAPVYVMSAIHISSVSLQVGPYLPLFYGAFVAPIGYQVQFICANGNLCLVYKLANSI